MKKIYSIVLFVICLLLVSGFSAAQEANGRYFVESNNIFLKMQYGIRHSFNNGFTTDLSPGQLRVLGKFGVKTEEVEMYQILGKPICVDDEICRPEEGENPSCADCKTGKEEPAPEERTCTPSIQKPWGITKVNGGLGGDAVIVAVLDTGVYTEHLDLTRRIADCKDFTKGPGIKNSCKDGNGHGTHVSGTILADGGIDGLGIIGVAPEAKLMAIKVLDDQGSGWADDIATAIRYAADNGANIISMSLGGGESSLINSAVDYAISKKVLVIAAAGNSGPTLDSIIYPAANPKVVAVAAFDSGDNTASFSSRGLNDGDWEIEAREIEFAAPGVGIESTWNNGCYNTVDGTSMATPHVAGIAARDWQDTAIATRTYLQGLAKNGYDYGLFGDDIEAGFGLPIALTP